MPDDLSAHLHALERRLRTRTIQLFAGLGLSLVLSLVAVLASMAWVEKRIVDRAYLLVSQDGVIHAMTSLSGEPKTASLSVATYFSGAPDGSFSQVELSAAQDGRAAVWALSGHGRRERSVALFSEHETGAGVLFEPAAGRERLLLTADERGLVVRTVDETGKATGEHRLARETTAAAE